MYEEGKLLQFRKQKDDYFRSDGPLTKEQQEAFKSLMYYPLNPKLVFLNVSIEPSETEETVEIQTSAGDTQSYKKAGKIHFSIDGKEYSLYVYKDTDFLNPSYFLPFKDVTSGKDTYV